MTEVTGQAQADLNQGLAVLRKESRNTRNLLMGITAGAAAIGIAALFVGILTYRKGVLVQNRHFTLDLCNRRLADGRLLHQPRQQRGPLARLVA